MAAVTLTSSNVTGTIGNSVQQHIDTYVEARDAFNSGGGQDFINDRREVRAAFCDATVSPESLEKWISNLATESVRDEFTHRFQEWNAKIAKGIITKSEMPKLTEEEFFTKLQGYYNKHANFLSSPAFENFTKAKDELRADIIPELKNATADTVAKRFGIKDEELISRMNYEWSWKAN